MSRDYMAEVKQEREAEQLFLREFHNDGTAMALALLNTRAQLAAAERERDVAQMNLHSSRKIRRYVAFVLTGDENADVQIAADQARTRAERAEQETAYIRRAFRGAVESDKLAITYQTIGSYRSGLLKTLNALDTRDGQGA